MKKIILLQCIVFAFFISCSVENEAIENNAQKKIEENAASTFNPKAENYIYHGFKFADKPILYTVTNRDLIARNPNEKLIEHTVYLNDLTVDKESGNLKNITKAVHLNRHTIKITFKPYNVQIIQNLKLSRVQKFNYYNVVSSSRSKTWFINHSPNKKQLFMRYKNALGLVKTRFYNLDKNKKVLIPSAYWSRTIYYELKPLYK